MTKQYLEAARTILNEGTRKPNRTGIDTISAFAVPMRFDLREGFPLLTTKKISWWHIVAENLWFLSGETHIGFLKKHRVKFWDAWADEDGFVPSAYGNFWRHFPVPVRMAEQQIEEMEEVYAAASGVAQPGDNHLRVGFNDQIAWVVEQLRTNPMSRRLVVSAWAPGNAQTSKLPPCHAMFVLSTQNFNRRGVLMGDGSYSTPTDGSPIEPSLCLHLTQRSCDTFLGVPYNIAGYAFILSLLAHLAGLEPGIFSHMLVDAHFYCAKPDGTMGDGVGGDGKPFQADQNHVPMIEEQLTREPRQLPRLTISDAIKELDDVKALLEAPKDEILDAFRLEGYDPHPAIKGAVAV